MRIGSKIRSIRESRHLSQNAVAERAGLKQGAFSQVENGIVTPRPKTLLRIFSALGLSEDEQREFMIEAKLQELDVFDSEMLLMLKDVRNMTSDEKQSIIDAYEVVKLKRARKRHD
jgi:transcriptional regulator with XRE-family HTH domain